MKNPSGENPFITTNVAYNLLSCQLLLNKRMKVHTPYYGGNLSLDEPSLEDLAFLNTYLEQSLSNTAWTSGFVITSATLSSLLMWSYLINPAAMLSLTL